MASLDLDQAGTLNIESKKADTFSISMVNKIPGTYIAITGAVGTTDITVTCTQSFSAGQNVHIRDVIGMTDLNGVHLITSRTSNDFNVTLDAATSQTYISDGTAAEFDTNYDLSSGFTAKMDIKVDKLGVHTLEWSTVTGEIVLGDGTITIDETATNMDIAAATYFHDFELTETATSEVITLFEGTLTINQDVTD